MAMTIRGMPDETREDFSEAADGLIAAVDYLQTTLNAGEGVLESKWIGAMMRAHELLLALSERPAASELDQ